MATLYTDLKSGQTETTESFFSDLFLRARIATGQESNKDYSPELWGLRENDRGFEDDVNIYMIHLLSSLIEPGTLEVWKKFAIDIKSDAGIVADNIKERSQKYLLYKVNADYLLLELGLFHKEDIPFHAFLDKGFSYYAATAGYRQEMDLGRSSIVQVYEKLAKNFGKYIGLLRFMKHTEPNFFDIFTRIVAREMNDLEQIVTLEAMLRKTEGLPN